MDDKQIDKIVSFLNDIIYGKFISKISDCYAVFSEKIHYTRKDIQLLSQEMMENKITSADIKLLFYFWEIIKKDIEKINAIFEVRSKKILSMTHMEFPVITFEHMLSINYTKTDEETSYDFKESDTYFCGDRIIPRNYFYLESALDPRVFKRTTLKPYYSHNAEEKVFQIQLDVLIHNIKCCRKIIK
jgi:hypothetical protein